MIGVGIISFNRPMYLRRLLKSLEAQTEKIAEFHLFNDGAINSISGNVYARKNDIEFCLRFFEKSRLPQKTTHAREGNVGIAIHQKEAIDFMSEQYDRIMIVEDDVILSPHWFRLARILFDEMAQHENVFSFNPGFRRMCDESELKNSLDTVQVTDQHMWCECFTANNWKRIQAHLKPYYDLVWDCDYRQMPREKIVELHKRRGSQQKGESQDVARVVAIALEGMYRVQCTANRGVSIGRQGLHFNDNFYQFLKLDKQFPYVHESDAHRRAFRWDLVPSS